MGFSLGFEVGGLWGFRVYYGAGFVTLRSEGHGLV